MFTEMISNVIPFLGRRQVILCFDIWYAKRTLIQPLQGFEQLAIGCNARHDKEIYDLPCRTSIVPIVMSAS